MNEYIIDCPCCNNKIQIQVDSSGNSTAFLLEENSISRLRDELLQKCNIELGILEGKKEVN